ncbi:uncharacterized protein LOC111687592 [Lucilia cuprina]|uniref:uncharacterized protein LOC111687592 n=1 Tax=Lucilia cuprina TaxID=7375 RepID=UPI000C71C0DC|nr:uncharacterized protein LOC111687592 [Lucilia cuprina]KAI8127334.1 hypothetical protein CVS40_3103 [Lucilia cuprina]
MKFLLFINIICVLVVANRAAMARGIFKDPEHPGKCVVEGLILSPGETAKYPHGCAIMTCYDDGLVIFYGCGSMQPPPGYVMGGLSNPSAPYPKCCRRPLILII